MRTPDHADLPSGSLKALSVFGEECIIVGSRETTCRKIAPRSREGREAKLYKGRNVSSNNVNKKEAIVQSNWSKMTIY